MNRIYILYFLFFLGILGQLVASDTFVRITNESDVNYSVSSTVDGGYILSGVKDEMTSLIKTESGGEVIWAKYFSSGSYTGFSMVKPTEDSGYILLTAHIEEDQNTALLIRTDADGDSLWTKELPDAALDVDDNLKLNIIQTADNGFLLAYDKADSTSIIKTNSEGEISWTRNFNKGVSLRHFRIDLFELSNGDFFFNNLAQIARLDKEGNVLFINANQRAGFAAVFSNEDFLLLTQSGNLIKTNSSGEIIWQEQSGSKSIRQLLISEDQPLIVSLKTLSMFDSSANMLTSKDTDLDLISGEVISDGFVFCAAYELLQGIIYKTDKALKSKYVIMTTPNDNSSLERAVSIPVTWIFDCLDNINIDYSIDGGENWINVMAGFPADSNIYNWITPGIFTDMLFIRICSSVEPDVCFQNKNPFSIHTKINDYITTEHIKMWFSNSGEGSYDPDERGSGFYWTHESNPTKTLIYDDGLAWAGRIGDSVRANGHSYVGEGVRPGNILDDGSAANPEDPRFGIWRANPDWQSFPEGGEKERLKYDWENWPKDIGAPWDPLNNQPLFEGEDTYWMVYNDFDTASARTYGANPIGLEIQLSIFDYPESYYYENDYLKDVIFKRYKILNKGPNQIDSMYFCYWIDPDLGDAGDDYVGCDTTLNMTYAYNAFGEDDVYGKIIPAIGYVLLQGPVVPGEANDMAYTNGQWITGYKNRSMSASRLMIFSEEVWTTPTPLLIEGSYEFYNFMQGLNGDGSVVQDPHTGQDTPFMLAGDPVNGTGWYEGAGWPGGPPPTDRRMMMSTGPFDFAPGDSQEVVFAIVVGIGNTHINSITNLKDKTRGVFTFYYEDSLPVVSVKDEQNDVFPLKFAMKQNYPNPFNPNTSIKYVLPQKTKVILKIYDVLGREVKTLVNRSQPVGEYRINFDARNLPSGIYFYRLTTSAGFEQSRKMILLK